MDSLRAVPANQAEAGEYRVENAGHLNLPVETLEKILLFLWESQDWPATKDRVWRVGSTCKYLKAVVQGTVPRMWVLSLSEGSKHNPLTDSKFFRRHLSVPKSGSASNDQHSQIKRLVLDACRTVPVSALLKTLPDLTHLTIVGWSGDELTQLLQQDFPKLSKLKLTHMKGSTTSRNLRLFPERRFVLNNISNLKTFFEQLVDPLKAEWDDVALQARTIHFTTQQMPLWISQFKQQFSKAVWKNVEEFMFRGLQGFGTGDLPSGNLPLAVQALFIALLESENCEGIKSLDLWPAALSVELQSALFQWNGLGGLKRLTLPAGLKPDKALEWVHTLGIWAPNITHLGLPATICTPTILENLSACFPNLHSLEFYGPHYKGKNWELEKSTVEKILNLTLPLLHEIRFYGDILRNRPNERTADLSKTRIPSQLRSLRIPTRWDQDGLAILKGWMWAGMHLPKLRKLELIDDSNLLYPAEERPWGIVALGTALNFYGDNDLYTDKRSDKRIKRICGMCPNLTQIDISVLNKDADLRLWLNLCPQLTHLTVRREESAQIMLPEIRMGRRPLLIDNGSVVSDHMARTDSNNPTKVIPYNLAERSSKARERAAHIVLGHLGLTAVAWALATAVSGVAMVALYGLRRANFIETTEGYVESSFHFLATPIYLAGSGVWSLAATVGGYATNALETIGSSIRDRVAPIAELASSVFGATHRLLQNWFKSI